MKSVLITGASGFIGGHLACRLRQEGYQVRCLVRRSSQRQRLEGQGIEFHYGDVTDKQSVQAAVQGVDCVFHLAGLTCALRWSDFLRVNAEACGVVAEACAGLPSPPVLIVVSSLAAAGPCPQGAVLRETTPPAPISRYGKSKLAGEQAARRWAGRVPITIVRPAIVFGPYDPGMRPVARSIYRWGLHLNPGFHSPRLSLIHVEDLCQLLVAAALRGERVTEAHDHDATGVYFAVADGQYPTYVELGKILAQELIPNKSLRVVHVPRPMAWTIGALNEMICWVRRRPDLLNRDKIREGTASCWACSGDKAARQLQWKTSSSLDDQLRTCAAWYLRAGWL